jgi:hypothetical protein
MPLRCRAIGRLGLALALLACPVSAVGGAGPRPLATLAGDPQPWRQFQDCVASVRSWGDAAPDWIVHSCPLTYVARKPSYDATGHPVVDAAGQPVNTQVTLTGRLFTPPAWRVGAGARLPLVVYAHGTELKKDHVPSLFGGDEWMLGAAAASFFGFAVVMPDLPGLGGDAAEYHPYCHGRSLAYALVDSVPAARRRFQEDPYLVQNGQGWDGRLFLVGYSEGGYSALAAAKELETHAEACAEKEQLTLTGSACMAGPFDLSGTTRRQILDPLKPFGHPFFIPYVLLGYNTVYGKVMDPLEALAPTLIRSGEDGNILEWADGFTDGLIVDGRIARRMGLPQDGVILRKLLNPAWVARSLDEPGYSSSPLRGILEENDLAPGWTPTRPILFCQSPDDRDVPMDNTRSAMKILSEAIRRAGREPRDLLVLRPLGGPGCGITHVDGAFLAIPRAFDWIYRGMPSED